MVCRENFSQIQKPFDVATNVDGWKFLNSDCAINNGVPKGGKLHVCQFQRNIYYHKTYTTTHTSKVRYTVLHL